MTLLVSLASYILASLHSHTSHTTYIYNNNTSSLYHLTWEFKKPFIISFIMFCFIQPKIKTIFISNLGVFTITWVVNSKTHPNLFTVPLFCPKWNSEWCNANQSSEASGWAGPGEGQPLLGRSCHIVRCTIFWEKRGSVNSLDTPTI